MSPIQFAYGEEGVSVKVFRNSRKLLAGYLLVTAAMLFAPVAKVEAQTGYLYMTDYGDGAMDRFSYTYSAGVYTFTPAGASSTDARWITGQGMNGGFAGNANDLIIATNATSTSGTAGLSRYGLNGALISTLTINNGGFTGGGNGTVLKAGGGRSGVGSVARRPLLPVPRRGGECVGHGLGRDIE